MNSTVTFFASLSRATKFTRKSVPLLRRGRGGKEGPRVAANSGNGDAVTDKRRRPKIFGDENSIGWRLERE